jgi:hypothetical protein
MSPLMWLKNSIDMTPLAVLPYKKLRPSLRYYEELLRECCVWSPYKSITCV